VTFEQFILERTDVTLSYLAVVFHNCQLSFVCKPSVHTHGVLQWH